jgi:hypothetical protein
MRVVSRAPESFVSDFGPRRIFQILSNAESGRVVAKIHHNFCAEISLCDQETSYADITCDPAGIDCRLRGIDRAGAGQAFQYPVNRHHTGVVGLLFLAAECRWFMDPAAMSGARSTGGTGTAQVRRPKRGANRALTDGPFCHCARLLYLRHDHRRRHRKKPSNCLPRASWRGFGLGSRPSMRRNLTPRLSATHAPASLIRMRKKPLPHTVPGDPNRRHCEERKRRSNPALW